MVFTASPFPVLGSTPASAAPPGGKISWSTLFAPPLAESGGGGSWAATVTCAPLFPLASAYVAQSGDVSVYWANVGILPCRSGSSSAEPRHDRALEVRSGGKRVEPLRRDLGDD